MSLSMSSTQHAVMVVMVTSCTDRQRRAAAELARSLVIAWRSHTAVCMYIHADGGGGGGRGEKRFQGGGARRSLSMA